MVFLSISYPGIIHCPSYFPTPTPCAVLPLAKLLAFVVQSQTSLHCTHLLATFPLAQEGESFKQQSRGGCSKTTRYVFSQLLPRHYTLSLFPKEGRATTSRRELNNKVLCIFPSPTPYAVLPLAKLLAFVVQSQTSLHCTHLLATFPLAQEGESFKQQRRRGSSKTTCYIFQTPTPCGYSLYYYLILFRTILYKHRRQGIALPTAQLLIMPVIQP